MTTYIDDHHRRWGALFGHEPWFAVQCALYEGPGHDWEEDAGLAMEQLLYALAKARGLDTTQVCPRCRRTVDQVRSLPEATSRDYSRLCDACEQQLEWEEISDLLVECERRAVGERWYASLTPEQRATADRESRASLLFYVDGLMTRDVQ